MNHASVALRSGAWFNEHVETLNFPATWDVSVHPMRGAPPLGEAGIRDAFARPIGAPRLAEMARGKRSGRGKGRGRVDARPKVAVVVDDITRPTPASDVMPVLLRELASAGVEPEDVEIVVGGGTHRPATRVEAAMKLGAEVCARYAVYEHNPYEDLVYVGTTSRGVRVEVNSRVARADLVIGIGGIYPHGAAGFSGGGKAIIPGVAGIDTIAANHRIPGLGYGVVDGCPNREDIEEGARLAGLRFSVCVVVDEARRICGLFTGHPVEAHRAAVRWAADVCSTPLPDDVDVVVANGYPMDTELFQAAKALGVAVRTPGARVVVLFADCTNGFGYHALCQPGGRMHRYELELTADLLGGRRLVIVSPNVSRHDVLKKFPAETVLCQRWDQAVEAVGALIPRPGRLRVAVLPTAPIQIYEGRA